MDRCFLGPLPFGDIDLVTWEALIRVLHVQALGLKALEVKGEGRDQTGCTLTEVISSSLGALTSSLISKATRPYALGQCVKIAVKGTSYYFPEPQGFYCTSSRAVTYCGARVPFHSLTAASGQWLGEQPCAEWGSLRWCHRPSHWVGLPVLCS